MEGTLPQLQVVEQLQGRGRHEGGLLDGSSGRADPVLIDAESAGRLIVPTDAVHQDLVHLPEERQRQR